MVTITILEWSCQIMAIVRYSVRGVVRRRSVIRNAMNLTTLKKCTIKKKVVSNTAYPHLDIFKRSVQGRRGNPGTTYE